LPKANRDSSQKVVGTTTLAMVRYVLPLFAMDPWKATMYQFAYLSRPSGFAGIDDDNDGIIQPFFFGSDQFLGVTMRASIALLAYSLPLRCGTTTR
jgi:hypothetical protein